MLPVYEGRAAGTLLVAALLSLLWGHNQHQQLQQVCAHTRTCVLRSARA